MMEILTLQFSSRAERGLVLSFTEHFNGLQLRMDILYVVCDIIIAACNLCLRWRLFVYIYINIRLIPAVASSQQRTHEKINIYTINLSQCFSVRKCVLCT